MKWLIIPTLIFAFLSRNPIKIAIVIAVAVGLWTGKSRQIPATASPSMRALQPYVPYLPALQIVAVFILLGGSLVVIALPGAPPHVAV
jgi:hypothetical protein